MTIRVNIEEHDDPPGTYRLDSDYSKVVRNVCRAVSGMRWDRDVRSWIGYPDALEIVGRRLKKHSIIPRGLKAMRAAELSVDHLYPVSYAKLRDYQKEGVDFLIRHAASGVLLADEMGCGKSAQAVRAIRALKKKTVVVCLAQNVGVWMGNDYMDSEVKKWWPLAAKENAVLQLEGTSAPNHVWRVFRDGKRLHQVTIERLIPDDFAMWTCLRCRESHPYVPKSPPAADGCPNGLPHDGTRIVVMHYDIAYAWVDFLINVWGVETVVFDELHEVVGERARRTKAVRALANACAFRIGLTGTPLPNTPRNFYQAADILSPGRFGKTFFNFGRRYCNGHQVQVAMDKVIWDFKGRSHEAELKKRTRFFMLRRLKSEVQKYLPPLIRETIDIMIPAKACLNVDLSVLKRSRIANQALALSADAKLPFVIDAIKGHLRAGLKVVAFTYRKLVAEHVADALRAAGFFSTVVHGDVLPTSKRDRRIAELKNLDGPGALCCTLDTCSTGIDLSFASVGDYVELSYEPPVIMQSMARLHRHGQKSTVRIQFFIGRGSIDELVIQSISSKLDGFEKIIGDVGESDIRATLDSMPKGRAALDALAERLARRGKR
jgi:SNF2 family DNA or RNA helicase